MLTPHGGCERSADDAYSSAAPDPGCERSAEDAYSSAAPDPTFAFVGVLAAPHSILYFPFCYGYVLHIVNFTILYFD
jgi:hypothetical protein